jgi:hypothetical protein
MPQEMRYLMRAKGFPALDSKVPRKTWEDLGAVSNAVGQLPEIWTRLVKDPHACQREELKVENVLNWKTYVRGHLHLTGGPNP